MAEESKAEGDGGVSAAPDSFPGGSKLPQIQAPFFVPVVLDPASGIPMIPLYPEQNTQQGGIFAVPMFGSNIYPPIPFAYNAPGGLPMGSDPQGAANNAAQQDGQAPRQEQQRVVRFRIGIQLDLLLIIKLVTMVFIFSQDGSRDRLLLLLLASVVYLYQTGALTPLLRWASERARRAMMPPVLVANAPRVPEVEPADDHAGAVRPVEAVHGAEPAPPAPAENREETDEAPAPAEDQIQAATPQEQQQQQPGNWRGFLREFQMIIVGFVTSLLPGFHNLD